MVQKIVFYAIFVYIFYVNLIDTFNAQQVFVPDDVEDTRARLLMLDGNMIFHAGRGKNITFKVNSGSSIWFGNTDILTLPDNAEVIKIRQLMATSSEQLSSVKQIISENGVKDDQLKAQVDQNVVKLNQLSSAVNKMNETRRQRDQREQRKMKKMVLQLTQSIQKLLTLLKTDECLNAPCKNGGTCIDLMGKYHCICPDHFEGTTCEKTIDECALFQGTHAGCQNNGTCENLKTGGFICKCPKGFFGQRCQTKTAACDYSLDLCGEHGHCVPAASSNSVGYRCLCEWGFKSSENADNPTCVDIDECLDNPCYPGATCLNLPGSFKCSACPPGTKGNGVHCHDFDECENEFTHKCSKDPSVECINTFGSYRCGDCPPGYEGDGYTCTKIQRCSSNPCHPLATCYEEPEFRCECPENMIGEGFGKEGCRKSNATVCHTDSCLNGGTCQPISESDFRCICPTFYGGKRCQHVSACSSRSYCNDHGDCKTNDLGVAICVCSSGYYGHRCQYEEEGDCGFHTHNETGEIVYQSSSNSQILRRRICKWTIQLLDTRKSLVFVFKNFTIPKIYEMTSKTCDTGFANLTVYDGKNDNFPQIATFCHGDTYTPVFGHDFHTSGSDAMIKLVTRIQRQTYISLKWKTINKTCGGRLSQKEGRIDYWDFHDEDNCVWYINTQPQYHIEITISSLKMLSKQLVNCSMNALQLYDNQVATNRTQMLQLCETQLQSTVIKTSGPYAAIYFHIDASLVDRNVLDACPNDPNCKVGFTITYRSVPLTEGCGGEILPDENNKMSGFIESPNYGHAYFPNLDCTWILNASRLSPGDGSELSKDATKIKIEFLDFDVATTVTQYARSLSLMMKPTSMNSCMGDYVKVSSITKNEQKYNEMYDDIDAYCNFIPPTKPLTAIFFNIKFHTDSVVSGRGFRLKYENVCEKEFTDLNGTISSPNYPNASPASFKCTYKIVADQKHAIKLRFKYIGLQTDMHTCFYNVNNSHAEIQDYIELSGGHESNENINKKYVCARYPFFSPNGEVVTSGIRPLSITYSTTGSPKNTGFLFEYEITDVGCGGVFSEERGVITSPDYPQKYLTNMYCVYHITVPGTKRIRLNFNIFDIENVAHRDGCGFDNVRVFESFTDENNHGKLIGTFCGMAKPPPLLSTENSMTIVFISDRSVNGAGFSATYQAIDASMDCDRTFTAKSGRIEFDPNLHPRATKCDYHILLPTMDRILFKLENISAPCDVAALMIRNGGSETSPGFPGLYRNSEICDAHKVPQLMSQGNRLFLRFETTNPSNTFFTAYYEQVETGCGGSINGLTGAISAPQYPQKDSRTLNCEWYIAVAAGNQIRLTFAAIDDLESADPSGFCTTFSRNYIDVAEGPLGSNNLRKRYCRKEVNPDPIISEANQLSVKYIQHGGSHYGALFGFLAHFNTVCKNIQLTTLHGTLQSPGYPGRVTDARNCKWTIETPAGSRILIHFHKFQIADSSPYDRYYSRERQPCMQNYIQVKPEQIFNISYTRNTNMKNLEDEVGTIPSLFCDNDKIPAKILTNSSKFEISFQSSNQPENHFWLTWSTVGCGGFITQNNTEISVSKTDFYYDETIKNVACYWTIKAPIGKVAKVTIHKAFFITPVPVTNSNLTDSKSACMDPSEKNFNGIAFFSGTSPEGVSQDAQCGVITDYKYTSHTNELFILFNVETSKMMYNPEDKTMLNGMVTFIDPPLGSSCGAIVKLKPNQKTIIQSPNFPKYYPRSAECIWQVEAPEGYTVSYNLTYYQTPNLHTKKSYPNWRSPYANRNITCSSPIAYVEGSLAFYDGPYNRETSDLPRNYGVTTFNSKGMLERICLDTNETKIVDAPRNISYIIFKGAPYDPIVGSGDLHEQPKIGFQMEVSAKCGGEFYAGEKMKSINIQGPIKWCRWAITIDPARKVPAEMPPSINMDPDVGEQSSHYQFASDMWPYVMIEGRNLRPSDHYLVRYIIKNNEDQFCGGEVKGHHGTLTQPNVWYGTSQDFECIWTITNVPGSSISVDIKKVEIIETEFCTGSYLEIRDSNSTGKLLGRFCKPTSLQNFNAQNFWIKFRSVNDSTWEWNDRPKFELSYKRTFGGWTNSHIIESPISEYAEGMFITWYIRAENVENFLQITIDEVNIPDLEDTYGVVGRRQQLRVYASDCGFGDEHSTFTPIRGFIACRSCCKGSENLQVQVFNGWITEPQTFIIRDSVATITFGSYMHNSRFKLHWDDITPEIANRTYLGSTTLNENSTEGWQCGGILVPTFDPQYLENPKLGLKYPNDMKCKWTIKRPLFHGLEFKFSYIDMEEHVECRYDYVSIINLDITSPDKLSRLDEANYYPRYCKKSQINTEIPVSYEREYYVYFITDRSRAFTGFKLEYKLTCRVFEYMTYLTGPLNHVITNPGYPQSYRVNESCFWSVMLETNRQVVADVVDIDIDSADGECRGDYLLVGERMFDEDEKFCGIKPFNKTLNNGRVYIKFNTDSVENSRRGFKLLLKELLHDCSESHLEVNEFNPIQILSSPDFPHMSPNSLDCHWVISAPPGHRVKFTVDPLTFHLQGSDEDECNDDFLEIRDGASPSSPLVGKWCHINPPSTIFSTDSHLYVRYVTDSYAQSMGWNATYELATCGGSLVLRKEGNDLITSPNYPNFYPPQTKCEWIVKAPSGHFVEAKVNHISFMSVYAENNCTTDFLTMKDQNATGDVIMPPICTKIDVDSDGYRSSHSSAYLLFSSNSSSKIAMNRLFCYNRKCGFEMQFSSSKFECGGVINDEEGTLHVPGYPDTVIPHLSCEWHFRAGIGSRYMIELEFVGDDHGFYDSSYLFRYDEKGTCFPDIEIWNGDKNNRYSSYQMYRKFCSNSSIFVSTSDIASVYYEDKSRFYDSYETNIVDKSRLYKPFHLKYKKVGQDFDAYACMYDIKDNQSLTITNMSLPYSYGRQNAYPIGAKSYCHIRVRRKDSSGTTVLKFKDFRAGRTYLGSTACLFTSSRVIITDVNEDPWPVNKILCTASLKPADNKTIELGYTNPDLDIHVINNPSYYILSYTSTESVNFDLTVTFNPCGGLLRDNPSGVIEPPKGADGNYTDNAFCIWTLQAPEGKVVSIEITSMNIEYEVECKHDVLIISEGDSGQATIHRYCNGNGSEPLADRFKKVKSRSRDLTLQWITDDSINKQGGFIINYEFVDYDSACGFVTHSKSGTIHSPNYPKDYPNNVQCLWDISVPLGFHIKLDFDDFDIAQSIDCKKDFLQLSQEHQSRAQAPTSEYYFYFDHEEVQHSICSNELPDHYKHFVSESNRLRINFTTDEKVTAKGFKLNWTAVCGTTFRLNHGVITSPHYPNYYPNENMECKYLIYPETKDQEPIVTLKVLDLDLAGDMSAYDYSPSLFGRCDSDYLEILDTSNQRVLLSFCGSEGQNANETAPISVKGGIGIRFVTNTSFYHGAQKNRRGFKISYALANCGGDIHLSDVNNELSTTITSPGFPLPYHHNLDCVWNVSAPEGRILSAKFTSVQLEAAGYTCDYDYVELYDGPIISNLTLTGQTCGDNVPEEPVSTTGRFLVVRFHTDHSMSSGGFKLSVTASLGPEKGCGGNLTATDQVQTFTPPLDPDGKYHNALRCLWTIKTADPKKIIELKFTKFEMESEVRKDAGYFDYIMVYDGPKAISPYLISPTASIPAGLELPVVYQSSSRLVDFYFESDSDTNFEGFVVEYQAVDSDCKGGANLAKSDCRFDFPSTTNNCLDEYLEIRDVGTLAECQHPACATEQEAARSLIRHCGSRIPARYISTTSVVQVSTSVVITSEYTAKFMLRYRLLSACNRTIDIAEFEYLGSGRITSPNYPNPYDHNSTCITNITAATGWRILLVFRNFGMERGRLRPSPYWNRNYDPDLAIFQGYRPGGYGRLRGGAAGNTDDPFSRRIYSNTMCEYDHLKIFYNTTDPNQNMTLCGFRIPSTIFSDSNQVILEMKTDASMSHFGYDLSYYSTQPKEYQTNTVVGSKTITKTLFFYDFAANHEKSGAITNIGYPNGYDNNTLQRWTLVPPSGIECTFTVKELDVTDDDEISDCSSVDHVRSAQLSASKKAIDLNELEWKVWPCKTYVTITQTFEAGLMYFIEFVTDEDSSNDGTGFRGEWTCSNYKNKPT
uniref:Cubilin n=1 Tax=Acrobeloides nanus TaxID=290746 RepID=A0A914BUV6_9BILA